MSRRDWSIVAAIIVIVVVIASVFLVLRNNSSPSQQVMLGTGDLSPLGEWGGGLRSSGGVSYWLQAGAVDHTEAVFELESDNASITTLHVILWDVVQHFNSTDSAVAGYEGLKTMLSSESIGGKPTWNISDVEVGDRAFVAWYTLGNEFNITVCNLVFQKADFTAVIQFDIRNGYAWNTDDAVAVASLQAGKMS